MRLNKKDFKKDKELKEPIPITGLKELVATLPDFRSEITLLQYCAKQLGVSINYSPKYYPEIAREMIEYC